MEKARNLVPSGVEPVDKLRGGLESGKLYLVHGEGPSKSLFGYQFLIEGLKRGEHVALIINYSPEDAVRWFARLGYDCLEDIYGGRLVVLECAEENLNQISRMKELSPVLRELRWLIGESNPERVVFEPIGRLVIGEQGLTGARSREFASWAGGIGSTSLLIANGRSEELITNLLPLVRESFRFELKQEGDLAIRYLFFEKSPDIPGQAIEADPSKGIFLVDRPSKQGALAQPSSGHEIAATEASETNGGAESSPAAVRLSQASADSANQRDPFTDLISELFADAQASQELEATRPGPATPASLHADEISGVERGSGFAGPEIFGRYEAPAPPVHRRSEDETMGGSPSDDLERMEIGGMVEDLLKPPAMAISVSQDSLPSVSDDAAPAIQQDLAKQPETGTADQKSRRVRPEDLNILVIASDTRSAERITRSLSEYHVEEAREGLSGLARLISFKPDLVVLDVDLRAVDGFEMLKHIRANLAVPIIAISSSRLRASDRIRSAELGADYYLTRPFSSRELTQKARQLIARYRRIDEWITRPAQEANFPSEQQGWRAWDGSDIVEGRGLASTSGPGVQESAKHASAAEGHLESISDMGRMRSGPDIQSGGASEPDRASILPYPEFVRRIEQMVELTIDGDAWFSVVGCRVNHNSDGHSTARTTALAQIVPDLIRNCDVASMNQSGDLMILLTDADQTGARAFTARLQETVQGKFKTDPIIWVRTFPFSGRQDE